MDEALLKKGNTVKSPAFHFILSFWILSLNHQSGEGWHYDIFNILDEKKRGWKDKQRNKMRDTTMCSVHALYVHC